MLTRGLEAGDLLIRGMQGVVAPVPPPPPPPPPVPAAIGGMLGGGPLIDDLEVLDAVFHQADETIFYDDTEIDEERRRRRRIEEEFGESTSEEFEAPGSERDARKVDKSEWARAMARTIGDSIAEHALPAPPDVLERIILYLGHPDDPGSRLNWFRNAGIPMASFTVEAVRWLVESWRTMRERRRANRMRKKRRK